MKFILLEEFYSIYQVESWPKKPRCLEQEDLFSVTATNEEISVACRDGLIEDFSRKEGGWKALKIDQVLDLNQVGVMAEISKCLTEANVSLFAISTFNTDYILIKSENLKAATEALKNKGYDVEE